MQLRLPAFWRDGMESKVSASWRARHSFAAARGSAQTDVSKSHTLQLHELPQAADVTASQLLQLHDEGWIPAKSRRRQSLCKLCAERFKLTDRHREKGWSAMNLPEYLATLSGEAGWLFGAAPLLGNYFKLSNKLINLKNLNYIEKDQQHEIYKMYFKDGLVAPLTAEEFQTMKGSNPVQTPFFCPLSEEVPALLTAREVVLRPEAVQRFGHSYCDSILKGCAYVA